MTLLLTPPTETESAPEPSAPATLSKPRSSRLIGVDIARGIALIGMMTVHVSVFGPDFEEPGPVASWLLAAPSGRASVLFFMLSGLSLSVIAAKGSRSAEGSVLRRRGAVLLLGGLLLSSGAWSASILEHYGVMFLLAPFFLKCSNRALLTLTAIGLIGGPIAQIYLSGASSFMADLPSGAATWIAQTIWSLGVVGTYPLIVWFGFFTLGVRLGRLDLRSTKTAIALVVTGVLGVFAVWGAVSALDSAGVTAEPAAFSDFDGETGDDSAEETTPPTKTDATAKIPAAASDDDWKKWDKDASFTQGSWNNLVDTSPHSGQIGWAFQSIAIAGSILGLALLAPGLVQRFLYPLRALGSISLTAYLLHTVLVTNVWTAVVGDGFSGEPEVSVASQLWLLVGLEVFLIISAVVIVRVWKTGPFERGLKQLTAR